MLHQVSSRCLISVCVCVLGQSLTASVLRVQSLICNDEWTFSLLFRVVTNQANPSSSHGQFYRNFGDHMSKTICRKVAPLSYLNLVNDLKCWLTPNQNSSQIRCPLFSFTTKMLASLIFCPSSWSSQDVKSSPFKPVTSESNNPLPDGINSFCSLLVNQLLFQINSASLYFAGSSLHLMFHDFCICFGTS